MRAPHPGTIQGALPILARALGRRLDVTVGIGGSDAYTDGKHIQLPSLPLDMSNEDLATLAYGYLEHEAAHVRYTDMDDYRTENGLERMFTNIFEDVRIEKQLGIEYPGFVGDLRGLTDILIRNGDMGAPPPGDAPLATKMGEYVLLRSRHDVLGPESLKAPAERAEEAFRNAVPAGLATRVGAALGRVRDLESTDEAAKLSREIVRLIEEEAEEQREQAKQPPDTQGTSPGDGEQQGSGDGSPGGNAQTGAGNGAHGDTGEADAAKAAADMADALQKLLQDDGDSGPKGPGEAAAEALGQAAAKASGHGARGAAGVGLASEPLVVSSTGDAALARVAGATVALRTRLRGLLAAAKQSSRRPARRGKRIDRRRLVKAMSGNPSIFVNKKEGISVNTAVQILLDRSGSMCQDIELARESALACGLGLSEIQGVNLAAAAFPGEYMSEGVVVPLTRFGEPVRRTAGRYASLSAAGGTPMLEALLWAVDELLVQPEPRKLCLVVTDGEPNDPEMTAEAIRRCWAGGLEVMGIGIGADASGVSELFPVSAHVSDVKALAGAMFMMLREALGGRPQA